MTLNVYVKGEFPTPPPPAYALEVTTVTGIKFQVKVAINSLAEFIDFTFSLDLAYR